VKRRKGGPSGLFPFLVIMGVLLLLAGISHVWVSFQRTQMGYTLSQLKKEISQAEERNRKLVLEIAFLKSPENLEKRAIKEFGLIHPLPHQVIYLP
jgi:cell division protein FtsL